MKIYRFTDHSGHSRAGTPDALTAYRAARHDAAPANPGGSDVVEISEEARNRYERARITSMEEARIHKLASEYAPLIHREIESDGDIPSQISHSIQVYDIRDAVSRSQYDFDNTAVLDETAESVFAFLLAG